MPALLFCQEITVSAFTTIIDSTHPIGLKNPVFDEMSPMTYYPDRVATLGGAFSINYINMDGGSNFDGYPNATIGGIKSGGKYYPANPEKTGMPVQIKNLKNDLRINWQTKQQNANDPNDKWWATINVIFDAGLAHAEPIASERDFDIVIELERYEQDELQDKPKSGEGAYWWFAREQNGALKTFPLFIEGEYYHWAVRYKFFYYSPDDPNEHKNNKVHVKFIPVDNTHLPPYLDHPLKRFIDCSIDYLQYIASLPEQESLLAIEKLAHPDLWIKSLSAGYEVYSGSSILSNEYFFTLQDSIAPDPPVIVESYLEENQIVLSWENNSIEAIDSYRIYRSEENESFLLIDSSNVQKSYVDANIEENKSYSYYITALDRSLNESLASEAVTVHIGEINLQTTINLYPNPVQQHLTIEWPAFIEENINIYNMHGIRQRVDMKVHSAGNTMIDVSTLKPGIYIFKSDTFQALFLKK